MFLENTYACTNNYLFDLGFVGNFKGILELDYKIQANSKSIF